MNIRWLARHRDFFQRSGDLSIAPIPLHITALLAVVRGENRTQPFLRTASLLELSQCGVDCGAPTGDETGVQVMGRVLVQRVCACVCVVSERERAEGHQRQSIQLTNQCACNHQWIHVQRLKMIG